MLFKRYDLRGSDPHYSIVEKNGRMYEIYLADPPYHAYELLMTPEEAAAAQTAHIFRIDYSLYRCWVNVLKIWSGDDEGNCVIDLRIDYPEEIKAFEKQWNSFEEYYLSLGYPYSVLRTIRHYVPSPKEDIEEFYKALTSIVSAKLPVEEVEKQAFSYCYNLRSRENDEI